MNKCRGHSITEGYDLVHEAETEIRNDMLEQMRIGNLIKDNNFKNDFDPLQLMIGSVEVNQNKDDNQKDDMNFLKL